MQQWTPPGIVTDRGQAVTPGSPSRNLHSASVDVDSERVATAMFRLSPMDRSTQSRELRVSGPLQ
jgi:hypothetical protein